MKNCYCISLMIIFLVIGIVTGWYITKNEICDDDENKEPFVHEKVTVNNEEETDRDISVLQHHLGSRGTDIEGSNFAKWRANTENTEKIYWS